MKKLLILLCFSILLTACAKTLPESKSSVSSVPSSEKTAPSAVPDETAAAINVGEDGVVYTMEDITPAVVDFSFRWLQQASLLNDIDAGKNVMVSPFSLYEALSMTANGAEGETLQEILNVFGADSLEELNAVTTYDGGEALTVSNSIWIAERMGSLNQAYVQRVVPYQAGVFSRPFNEATKNEINQWVYEKTNGMIPNFLSQMDPGLAMLLFNAICFEGTWLDPYRDDQIAENETFTNAEGKQEITTMLKSGSECLYFSLNGADCTVKSYEGEKLVFVGIRPADGQTVSDFLKSLTTEDYLQAYCSAYHPDRLDVHIPEFSYDYQINATDSVQDLGVRKAFTDQAEFDGILENGGPLSISSITQKTHIELDRTGTKAAAVTQTAKASGAYREPNDLDIREVILDRPFLYAIADSQTGLPIFLGVVNTVG